MPVRRLLRLVVGVTTGLAISLVATGVASATPSKQSPIDRAAYVVETAKGSRAERALTGDATFSGGAHQHGENTGHLPGSSEDVELISSLEPTDQFGDIVPGQIADLAVYKDFAYLNSWSEDTCTKGGTYVVDIRDPRHPKDLDFIPALPKNYHGEGAHVISVTTKAFSGDVLAVNNETCAATDVGGGFDLYDVSDPANPKVLIQGAGDFGGEGRMSGPGAKAREYHSVFMWKNAGKVYLVASDNEELHDVDIFDITDPRHPKPVAEYDFAEEFPQILETPAPYGNLVFNHDFVVKEIGGRKVLLDSYWDAGYVMVDVENPAKISYIGDNDFGALDPLFPNAKSPYQVSPPEGNAHQAEFSHDSKYFLAADEDFNPYRADKFFIGDQEFPAAEVGGGTSAAALPDQTLNGPVVYGGYGCDASTPIPPRSQTLPATLPAGQEAIVVLQRGPAFDPDEDYDGDGDTNNDSDDACFPGDKAANAIEAGYDAVLLANRHQASGSQADDEPYCGSGGFPAGAEIVTLCTTHEGLHTVFGDAPEFAIPYDDDQELVPLGTVSTTEVRATSLFDGWGYAHLYKREAGKVTLVDSYAIPEALDPQLAFGHGDLSIHEFAADPGRNIAYSSYYAGGLRVFSFGAAGIEEVGHYIDADGNNFWGVETFVAGDDSAGGLEGKRLIAASDRDHGLFLFRYEG
jgi:hypothetical protein